jgi:tripartite-type tricarboxylate transporter receptor subunit TctC
LNHEAALVLRLPEVKERFLASGVEAVGSTPEAFGALVRSEMTRLGKLIRDAGIQNE